MSRTHPVLPFVTVALALALAAGSEPASAHIVRSGASGFGGGFEHPLTGLDHILAMFAVGLWGAQMGGRPVWSLPVTFPMIMVLGGALGLAGVVLPGVEIGIALSSLVLGLAIAARWSPPEWGALLVVAAFAVFHGYAHGAELPNAADPADFAIGFVIATGLIHVVGIGVGLGVERLGRGRVSQALGCVIALGGVYFLAA